MTNYDDIFTSTLESRTGSLADNVSKSNALLKRLQENGKIREISGGSKILEELEYGEGDLTWYSGYEAINYTPKQLFTAAEYSLKLCAVPVAVSGEDLLKNAGHEQVMSLLEKRIENACKTMRNKMSAAVYSDGTGSDGKEIGGLALLVADAPETGTVGGINRASAGNEFWRNKSLMPSEKMTSANIMKNMDALYLQLCRGSDRPDLIVAGTDMYTTFEEALTPLQRFSDGKMADAGFVSLKYKNTDVIFDGGAGGHCADNRMYFLNTNYIYLRPHKERNMAVIGGERMAVNQDAMYKIIGWAGNMTMSNASLQGVLINPEETAGSGNTESSGD